MCISYCLRSFLVFPMSNNLKSFSLSIKVIFLAAIDSFLIFSLFTIFPTRIYLFKVNNGNTRTICDVCSKETKTSAFTDYSIVSMVDFELVNPGWVVCTLLVFVAMSFKNGWKLSIQQQLYPTAVYRQSFHPLFHWGLFKGS